ncbi:MAG TPA: NAD-dependent epimerase/dehydratase family protein [Bacillota bacterium]|nr:NAD-dependent epimerase/dehydratase family protein [Bacillota bacterium]
MRLMIIGGDGYLGWPTAMHFSRQGDEVAVFDSGVKRRWEAELGAAPLGPVASLRARIAAWRAASGRTIQAYVGDVTHRDEIRAAIRDFAPAAVVHYGEQPSAPFSMIDAEHAIETQANNVLGTLQLAFALRDLAPDAHLIKLGTMGEYGTPNIDIEEGFLDIEWNGRRDRLPFPKSPGSFYHLSKVHDSHNLMLAARLWGLRVTDLNQGVVYGTDTEETRLGPQLATSFHYDAWFGTVINRFVAQAVAGVPLTVYGGGGQRRAFLNIRDTLQCVELAARHPAAPGEFRVFNQFTECFSVDELADRVVAAGRGLGLRVERQSVSNPRVEAMAHHYNPKNSGLRALGMAPRLLSTEVLGGMLAWTAAWSARIDPRVILPTVDWRRGGGSDDAATPATLTSAAQD